MSDSESVQGILSKARDAFFDGEVSVACDLLHQAKQIDPSQGMIFAIEAGMKYDEGDYDTAKALWDQAIKKSPDNEFVSITYFVGMWGLNDFSGAATEVKRFLERNDSLSYVEEIKKSILDDPKSPAGDEMIKIINSLLSGDLS